MNIKDKYDVIIIGSGPSGSISAYYLARNGIKCLLIEKAILPRYKPCGGGLSYKAKSYLPYNIKKIIEREFNQVLISMDKGEPNAIKRSFPVISTIMRDKLDYLMAHEARIAGVDLKDNCALEKLEKNNYYLVHTSRGLFQSKFIIAADGVNSKVAKLLNVKEKVQKVSALQGEVTLYAGQHDHLFENLRFDVGFVPNGYSWTFPKKSHLSIGVLSMKKDHLNYKEIYADYLRYLGIKKVKNQSIHGYSIPMTPRRKTLFFENILFVGDAAGLVDPVTAEGISNAIISGKIATEALIEGKLFSEEVKNIYLSRINQEIIYQLKHTKIIAKLFYTQDWLRKSMFNRYGDLLVQTMTHISSGYKNYPNHISTYLKYYLKARLVKQ